MSRKLSARCTRITTTLITPKVKKEYTKAKRRKRIAAFWKGIENLARWKTPRIFCRRADYGRTTSVGSWGRREGFAGCGVPCGFVFWTLVGRCAISLVCARESGPDVWDRR